MSCQPQEAGVPVGRPMSEAALYEQAKLDRVASNLSIPKLINVKLTLVPQRSCKLEDFLLKKIKLMLTMDPRMDGDALMRKVTEMLPRAKKMITTEITNSPDGLGLVIQELTAMSMEAVLTTDNYAIHNTDVMHELFKTDLSDPLSTGEITVNVEVTLVLTYRNYSVKGTLQKNGDGFFGSWANREFCFNGNPYKASDDFEAEGQLTWISRSGKMKKYVVVSMHIDADDPNVLCVRLKRKQDERHEIKLRGENLKKFNKQIKDFLRACEYVKNPAHSPMSSLDYKSPIVG